MKTSKSITRAFCVELQQELSIVAARREYFSQALPRERFSFLCSSESCRAQGVKITGVRYDVKPQENLTFVAAHFRANPHYEHHADCEWVEVAQQEDDNATPEESALRKIKGKLDDYIDVFDPLIKEPPKPNPKPTTGDPVAAAQAPASGSPKEPRLKQTRTHNLERLVDSFRQAQAQLTKEELALLTLRIPGQGEVTLRSYFRHIKFAQVSEEARVLYGGALVERYGTGFKFNFFDRHQGKRVSLYVPSAQMQAYRSSRYISELLSHADDVRFFTVFALGTLAVSPSGKSLSVQIADLQHLAIVLGPAKDPSAPAIAIEVE